MESKPKRVKQVIGMSNYCVHQGMPIMMATIMSTAFLDHKPLDTSSQMPVSSNPILWGERLVMLSDAEG